jgi:hypothetical protein
MATISGEGDQSYKMLRKRKQTYIWMYILCIKKESSMII